MTEECDQCASRFQMPNEKSIQIVNESEFAKTPSTAQRSRQTENSLAPLAIAKKPRKPTEKKPTNDETKFLDSDTRPSLDTETGTIEQLLGANTASPRPSTIKCSPVRAEGAPSADAGPHSASPEGSALTIATRRGECAVFSADFAISASADSATISSESKWPQSTCGCAKSKQWLIWVELNAEEEAIADALRTEALAIRGSHTSDQKESGAQAWMRGDVRILISKASIFGFGLNFQFADRMAFVGVKDSYESTYQAIRRCWRFGQKRSVHVHVFASELEGEVVKNLERKERDAFAMSEALSAETREVVRAEILGQKRQTNAYGAHTKAAVPAWM